MDEMIIRSEDDAFYWIKRYLDNELDESQIGEVKLEGWPKLSIRLTGKKFDQSLTPSVMKGFIDLQNAINRAVALEKTGVPDPRKLSKEERDEIEIQIRVEKGSSILEVNFQELITTLGVKAVGTMDPVTLTVTILGLAAVWGSTTAFKGYLQHRKEVRETEVKSESEREHLSTMRFLSERESERAKMLVDLAAQLSSVDNSARFADDARGEILKRFATAQTTEIDGVVLDDDLAKELTKNARRKSEDVRLDGEYRVLRNDTTDSEAFKVRLENSRTGAVIDARVQDDSLTTPIKSAIQVAEWSRTTVNLKVNAKSLDGTIKNAVVIGLVVQDEPESPQS